MTSELKHAQYGYLPASVQAAGQQAFKLERSLGDQQAMMAVHSLSRPGQPDLARIAWKRTLTAVKAWSR